MVVLSAANASLTSQGFFQWEGGAQQASLLRAVGRERMSKPQNNERIIKRKAFQLNWSIIFSTKIFLFCFGGFGGVCLFSCLNTFTSVGHLDWMGAVAQVVKESTGGRTEEIKVFWIQREGAAGKTAEERLCATGKQRSGAKVKPAEWGVWGRREFSFLVISGTVSGCSCQLGSMAISRWVA